LSHRQQPALASREPPGPRPPPARPRPPRPAPRPPPPPAPPPPPPPPRPPAAAPRPPPRPAGAARRARPPAPLRAPPPPCGAAAAWLSGVHFLLATYTSGDGADDLFPAWLLDAVSPFVRQLEEHADELEADYGCEHGDA